MKKNILANNTIMKTHQSIFKYITMVAIMLTIGVGQAFADTDVTHEFKTSNELSGTFDSNISWRAYKGSGTSDPAANTSRIRLYRNTSSGDNSYAGGFILITAASGYYITGVKVWWSTGQCGYKVTSATTSGKKGEYTNVTSNTKYTISNASALQICNKDKDGNMDVTKIQIWYAASAYHVTYNKNTTETVSNMPTDNTDYAEGDDVNIPNTTPTRTGYTFANWYTNKGCTTPSGGYAVNTSKAFKISGNTTLYAKWTPNPYRVDVASPNHVTIGVSSPSTIAEGAYANVNCGATVTLSESSLDAGYTAVWKVYKTSDENVTVSVSGSGNGATFTMPAYPVTVTKTITAPWIYFTSCSNKKRVYYNANTSDVSVANMPTDNNEYDENDYVSIPNTTPTRTGYTFYRWYTNEGCTTPAAGYAVNTSNAFQITANTTLYAKWNVNEYRIDVATPDRVTIKATPSGGSDITEGNHANAEFGQTVTLNYTSLEDGYGLTWDVYKTGDASTKVSLSSTTANNATFTMPAYPVTVTATTAVRPSTTVTFYLGTSNTASGTLSIGSNTIKFYNDEAGITALPTVSSISCGDWNTVVGWTENSSYSSSSTPPTMISASVGTPYKPATNKTVYAVYKKVDGSDDFDGTNSGTYYIRATPYSTSYYASECMGSDVLLTSGEIRGYTSDEDKVAYTFTKVSKDAADYYNITCDGTNYLTSNSGSLSTTTTYNADAALWSVSEYAPSGAAGTGAWRFANKSTSRNFVFTTNSRNRFVDWAAGNFANSGYPLELLSANTNYYSVNPECTSITVTKGTCTPNSSVLDASSHACDFKLNNTNNSSVTTSSGGSVTIYLYPNDDYTDVGATVSVDVPGNVTTINAINTETHTCLISGITGDITVSVSYVERPKYTVTLYDNGVLRTTKTEEHYDAGVTLPSGNNCTPGSEFTFVGWTESAVELNADPVRPATLHAAGSYVPTSDITLYSVYSRSVAGCEDFAAGVSGAYKMYNNTSDDYAKVTANANRYDKGSSGDAEIFYIAYAPAHTAYTIRTSLGYLGWQGGVGSEELTKNNATPYYWNLKANASGKWNFEPVGVTGKQFSGNNTYFNLHSNSTKYYIRLEKSAMTYYYNTALCGDAKITFHDGGGSISGTPTTPTGASWNGTTHVLSGLEDCDKITTFPTASYDGWTFVGWSTEDYTNCGKHTAGTSQYAEENASTEEPDASNIYKTDGNPYVVRGGSIDLYPIFTRFPDNEPFDIESGGRYYMYYLDPDVDDGFGAPARRYAGAWDGTKRYTATTSCAEATEFEFTKSGDVWHIQNTANDKWLGGKSSDDWLIENNSLGTLTDWTITIRSGNQFNATCQSGRQISVYQNFFMDYSSNNLVNNPGYYCVYLGSCEERIFSSEPHPTPILELSGEPYVTSSASQRVRATATMTLTAVNLTSVPATRVKVTGTNLTFATSATATPATPLWVDLVSGAATATIYVYYTPTATEDGLENVIVTAQAYNTNTPKDLQTTGTVHGRHLPANFVIAAKLGDNWYALPSTCNSSGSSTTGVLITVDNDSDPTSATYAPSTTKWGLRQTKQPSRITAGYADRLTFTERGTTATADNQQALYNYNSADIYTNGQWTNYANTNPGRYEWIPVTSDFKDYTLTNAEASKPLILRNDGEFKAQTTNQAYDGKVRLLPATFYEDNIQIVEWKTNSVVVMYTGSQTSATTKVGTNSEGSAQTLSTHKLTHGIYELTTGSSLTSNAGKNLVLKFGADVDKKMFEIPIIVNGSTNASTGHDKQDVVILKNGKLTAHSTKYSYRNIYVYGGGKLKIASGTSLGVNNIILRAGGITTSGIGSSPTATYDYVYPQVELGGTLTSTKTDIKYEYITDYDHWYHLCLPFGASLSSITYPVEYYGRNVTEGNTGSWIIKRYDGATRATGSYAAWKDIENDVPKPTTTTAGQGYIFWGAPKKVSVGGAAKERQKWGIQRMTMSIAAAAAVTAETNDKNISVDSYSEVATSTKPNDQGWNLVGNPFMANLTGLTSESLIAGKLVHTDTDPWDGKWKNNGDGTRYVTIPDNHFDNYVAKTTATASGAGDFMPGRTFFVQIAEGATTLTFATANRASLMPALYAKTEASTDIETGIVMSDETHHDEVNFWIKDGKTADYESNADYPKTPNGSNFNIYGVHEACDLSWIAISPEIAEGSMAIGYQVPTAGEYTLSLSETYVSDKIDHVFVTDHAMSPEITTDLMDGVYNFQVNQAETNNTRFTVSIQLKEESPGTATGVDDIRGDSDKPTKFIYHDKMYILRGGVIYDATGKKVQEINK